jgi:DNA (cytosine-5)-methyltransferase 1
MMLGSFIAKSSKPWRNWRVMSASEWSVHVDAVVKKATRGTSSMRHLDLFSGIGGFALAARWAGFETVGFCEIEDYPRKVLEKNFPGVPVHRDIKELNGSEYAGVELITGGYPCQPFSVLGKRQGAEDDRHLWPEMLRIITQARPTWIVAENVIGHITMGLDRVITDLENEGYTTRPVIIPAGAVGARHLRDRVWLISYASGERRQQKPKGTHGNEKENERRGAQLHNEPSGMAEALRGREWWATEPAIHKLADGLPARLVRDMNRALGNAIVPQVAYEILRSIKAV